MSGFPDGPTESGGKGHPAKAERGILVLLLEQLRTIQGHTAHNDVVVYSLKSADGRM